MIIIGAGGHSRSVIALLRDNNLEPKGIYDESWMEGSTEQIFGIPLSGKIKDISDEETICLSIGDNTSRKELFSRFSKNIYKPLIKHSTAFVDKESKAGDANLVFGKAFINAGVKIGANNILNTGCIIEHECVIGDHNHISVSAVLCGRVTIGNNCFIGAASVIKEKIKVCDNVIIGSGSVVVRDITEPGVYVGNPSKRIK